MLCCLLLTISSIAFALPECPTYYTVAYDANANSARCAPCPANCAACVWNEEAKAAECSTCKETAYKNPDGTCSPCITGCQACTGPEFRRCLALADSYYFDSRAEEIKKCPNGCASCDHYGNCFRCEPGYRHENKKDERGNLVTNQDNLVVKCFPCQDSNCNYCEVDTHGSEFCVSCLSGYGLNSKTSKCMRCQEGCLSCQSNSDLCTFCKEDYQRALDLGSCMHINIPFCSTEDFESQTCSWCKNGYVPNPSDRGSTCASCSVVHPMCSHCREKNPSDKAAGTNGVVCTACPSKFALDIEKGTCVACPLHCSHCSPKNECYSCDPGFQEKDGKCLKKNLHNCELPEWNSGCSLCKSGFYNDVQDGKKCKRCHRSCLMCNGPEEDDCTSCGLNKYAFRVADDSPFSSFFSATKLKCVDHCPRIHNNNHYVEHETTRECVIQTEKEIQAKFKYSFNREVNSKSWDTVFHDSEEFVRNFKKYAKQIIETNHHWAKLHPKEAAKYSAQCNYRGELVEKMSASRETYYHCDCARHAHGVNCEFDDDLHSAVQIFAEGLANDLRDLTSSMSESMIEKIINNLCEAPLSIDSLYQVGKTIRDLMNDKVKNKVQDLPQFLNMLDHILKATYNEKDQFDHRAIGFERDIEYLNISKKIYSQFADVISLGDRVFRTSIPFQTNVVDASTQTFQVTDHIADEHTFTQAAIIKVLPPNLLGQNELMTPIWVFVKNEVLNKVYQNHRVVVWSYSRHLFNQDLNAASHLVYLYVMKVTEKKATFVTTNLTRDDGVVVRFPLRVIPAETDLKRVLSCKAVQFGPHGNVVNSTLGEIVKFGNSEETDRPYAVCKFVQVMWGYYYTIVYTQENLPQVHMAKTARALSDSTGFILKKTLKDKARISSSKVLSLAAVFFTMITWMTLGL